MVGREAAQDACCVHFAFFSRLTADLLDVYQHMRREKDLSRTDQIDDSTKKHELVRGSGGCVYAQKHLQMT